MLVSAYIYMLIEALADGGVRAGRGCELLRFAALVLKQQRKYGLHTSTETGRAG
jgi:pyrroline-5-carboxylate reductase